MSAKIIYVGASKGGIGKTLTNYNLSGALARLGYKVLCIDLDSSCNLSTTFGYLPNDTDDTICDALTRICTGRAYDPHKLIHSSDVGIDYVPSSKMLSTFVAQLEATHNDNILGNFFAPLIDEYDYIIVDSSAAMDAIKRNILYMSEYAILLVEGAIYSFDMLSDTAADIEAIRKDAGKISILGIVHNKVRRANISKAVIEAAADMFGDLIFDTKIPSRQAMVEQSIERQKPCIDIKSNTLGEVYRALAEEVVNKTSKTA